MINNLKKGDKVALIAPASGQKANDIELVDKALSVLKNWGLSVILTPKLENYRYLAASDTDRAMDLIRALTNPDIKAIFVTRGGYGCARLLPYLDSVVVPTHRYLIGFSDITTLHLYSYRWEKVINIHAPNVATQQFLGDNPSADKNRQALYNALFNGVYPSWQLTSLFTDNHHNNIDNMINTDRVGGCLSLLVSSLGTPYEINTNNKVLMIEEVCEAPYKIDRMLTHLRNAGKFDNVKAIVFGEMLHCDSTNIALADVLRDEFADDRFPVFSTDSFGHGAVNLPLHLGYLLNIVNPLPQRGRVRVGEKSIKY